MEFLRTNVLRDWTVATGVKQLDLPVNPLSFINITMDFYNATDEATLAEILAFINKLQVHREGRTIYSLESEHSFAHHCYLFGTAPKLTSNVATDDKARAITLIIPFGRRLYDPKECYPATKKGELTLSMDLTIPATSLDNAIINVEVCQLPEAAPTHYLKCTQKNITAPGATGANEVPLPIGNDILAIFLKQTTFPDTSSHTYGVDNVTLLKNDQEHMISESRMHNIVGDMGLRYNTLFRDIAAAGEVFPTNFAWLDLDPHSDGEYALKTEGASSVDIELDMGVDEATQMSLIQLVTI